MAYKQSGILSPEANKHTFSLEEELMAFGTDTLDGVQETIDEFDLSESELVASTEGIKEGLDQGLNYAVQSPVLYVKHIANGLSNIVSSTEDKIATYETKLIAAKEEFNRKRSDFAEGEHIVHLMELWYFFTRRNGPTKNIMTDLANDIRFSEYALSTYPKQLIAEIKKCSSMVGRKISDKDVEQIKTAVDLFDTKYLGDEKYFDVVSVELDGQSVIEKKSKLHRLGKAGAQLIANPYIAANGQSVELTESDIGKLLDNGLEYIENVKAYVQIARDLSRAFEHLAEAASRADKAAGANPDEIAKVLQKASSYRKTISKLCNQEIARSLKGARYCLYIGLRGIYNATKYIK